MFGFFTNLIITVLLYAGEVIDTEIGLGMAKAYDPATGVTMPVFGNYYYYLFILYFFQYKNVNININLYCVFE